jgi:hypothetical protein
VQGSGSQIVGGILAIGMGVIVIAAIYQLGQQTGPNGIPATTEAITGQTLSSIFK